MDGPDLPLLLTHSTRSYYLLFLYFFILTHVITITLFVVFSSFPSFPCFLLSIRNRCLRIGRAVLPPSVTFSISANTSVFGREYILHQSAIKFSTWDSFASTQTFLIEGRLRPIWSLRGSSLGWVMLLRNHFSPIKMKMVWFPTITPVLLVRWFTDRFSLHPWVLSGTAERFLSLKTLLLGQCGVRRWKQLTPNDSISTTLSSVWLLISCLSLHSCGSQCIMWWWLP